MDAEGKILARLRRRLLGERGAVMLEFAFVAPLVFMLMVFATDFTTILRTEQQLEIAARLAADVEAHMATADGGEASPSATAKKVAKYYLLDIARVGESNEHIYVKGDHMMIFNLASDAVDGLVNLVDNGVSFSSDSRAAKAVEMILNGLLKVLGTAVDVLTFRTDRYITRIFPHDREVRVTVAAYIRTILPGGMYRNFGYGRHTKTMYLGVWQAAPNLVMPEQDKWLYIGLNPIEAGRSLLSLASKRGNAADLQLVTDHRHRVYCYMPVMDSVPMAPETYVREFIAWAKDQKWWKWLEKIN